MAKKLLIFIFLAVLAFPEIGIRLTGGWSAPWGGDPLGFHQVLETNGTISTDKAIYYSGGMGVPVNLDLIIGINDILGVVLGGGYNIGVPKITGRDNTKGLSRTVVRQKGFYAPVNLGLELQYGGRVRIWAGTGMTIAAGAMILADATNTIDKTMQSILGSNSISQVEYKFYPGFGFYTSWGMDFGFNENIFLTFSIKATMLNLKIKTETITKSERDGVDLLEGSDKIFLVTEYAKEDTNKDDSPDKPDWGGLPYTIPFNSFSVNLGVTFRF